MKVKVEGYPDEVEVGQFRELNKGAIRGFFSLVIYPLGIKILDCKLFEKDGRQWIAFPSKESVYKDVKQYIPYVSIANKEYLKCLQDAVLKAITEAPNAQDSPKERQQNPVSAQSSAWWETNV